MQQASFLNLELCHKVSNNIFSYLPKILLESVPSRKNKLPAASEQQIVQRRLSKLVYISLISWCFPPVTFTLWHIVTECNMLYVILYYSSTLLKHISFKCHLCYCSWSGDCTKDIIICFAYKIRTLDLHERKSHNQIYLVLFKSWASIYLIGI